MDKQIAALWMGLISVGIFTVNTLLKFADIQPPILLRLLPVIPFLVGLIFLLLDHLERRRKEEEEDFK